MKHRTLLLLLLLLLNCPKKYAPKVEKIEVLYLSSLYEDIRREEPYLAGIKNIPGIKIGYLKTEPPCIVRLLSILGFYQLLNEFPIDFVICDTTVYNVNYMTIPESMGYGITNYKGIRFAILCKDKDSLTIEDEITLTLVKQRSDILWIVDKNLQSSPPMKIDFFIKNRSLADTSMTAIQVTSDTTLLSKLHNFKNTLNEVLRKKIYLEGKRLDEYVLSKVAHHEEVDIILYPDELFGDKIEKDSISVQEFLDNVRCEIRFKKPRRMTEDEIIELSREKQYQIWGKLRENNKLSLPDTQGTTLFDMLYPPEILKNE